MKHRFSLWLSLPATAGVVAFALMPAIAQNAAPANAANMGKIHGQITNPTGQAQPDGEIDLSTDGGHTIKYTFHVDANGQFTGEAPAGSYAMIYRDKDTPPGKMVDENPNVQIVAGQDTTADDDMSRAAFISKMSPEQQKQLADLKKQNSSAVAANKVIATLNADLKVVNEDIHDADPGTANKAAAQQLGAGATVPAVAAKSVEIQNQKYTDVVNLMQKDTKLKPDEPLLWADLGSGQKGLKQYDQAIASYQKALSLEQASKKPSPEILGSVQSGLGECYARAGKVPEANAAFAAAAKDNPTSAPTYYRNQAVIYFQEHNSAAQVAAADQALTGDPTMPDDDKALLYYLKGQGLVQNSTIDPKTNRIVLPPDCADAYQKYLQLAPNGQFAAEVQGILQQAGEKVSSSYKAPKKR